jgi:hypothetical protein
MKTRASNHICFLLGLVLCLGLISCKSGEKHNGFTLQRFKIIDEHLAATIKGVCDSSYILEKEDEVLLLDLRFVDSISFFVLTSASQKIINEYLIFSCNSRIVGFIEEAYLPADVIVISNTNGRVDFETMYYKFIIPTKDKKRIDYIYFPDDQYAVNEVGKGYPPPFFDPYYYVFEYTNGEFVPVAK